MRPSIFFSTMSAVEPLSGTLSVAHGDEWNIQSSGRGTIYRCMIVAFAVRIVLASRRDLPMLIPADFLAALRRDDRASKFVAGAVAGLVVGRSFGASSGNGVQDLCEESHREQVEIGSPLIPKEKGEQ